MYCVRILLQAAMLSTLNPPVQSSGELFLTSRKILNLVVRLFGEYVLKDKISQNLLEIQRTLNAQPNSATIIPMKGF